MKTLETIAADLAEYVAARVTFLEAAAKQRAALAMTDAQHREVARLMMSAERYITRFEQAHDPSKTFHDCEADLVGALDAFYTGLAHLAMAYHLSWGIPEAVHATTSDADARPHV